jgi:hypothetical protein
MLMNKYFIKYVFFTHIYPYVYTLYTHMRIKICAYYYKSHYPTNIIIKIIIILLIIIWVVTLQRAF